MAAEPVQRIADGPGWAEERQLIAVALQATPKAYADWLASGCGDTSPAADMLGLVLGVIRHLDETVQAAIVGEAAIEAACERAVAEDRAARRPRGNLRAL